MTTKMFCGTCSLNGMRNKMRKSTALAMLVFLAAVFCFLASACPQHPAAAEVYAVGAKRSLRDGTVIMPGGSGGCIVNDRRQNLSIHVTCEHVVRAVPRYGQVDFRYPEIGRRIRTRLITLNAPHDIALTVAEYLPGLTPIRIARTKPAIGDIVISPGFPGIVSGNRYRELIGQVRRYSSSVAHLEIDVGANTGHSGGIVYNQRFELVGLVAWQWPSERFQRPVKCGGPYVSLEGSPALQSMIRGWRQYAMNQPAYKYTMINKTSSGLALQDIVQTSEQKRITWLLPRLDHRNYASSRSTCPHSLGPPSKCDL